MIDVRQIAKNIRDRIESPFEGAPDKLVVFVDLLFHLLAGGDPCIRRCLRRLGVDGGDVLAGADRGVAPFVDRFHAVLEFLDGLCAGALVFRQDLDGERFLQFLKLICQPL